MGKVLSLTLATILSLSIFTYVDGFTDGQVRVAGHRMSVDTAGVLHISGIVENASNSAVGFVHVTAYLFDEDGKELPTYDTYALLRNIPAGYIAPFDIPISDKRVGNSIASYTLSLEWKATQRKADKFVFTDINAFVWTHIDPNTKQPRNPHASDTNVHHDSHAHTEISALVKNAGDLATKTVKVITIWYDERGQYYSYNMQTIARQLMPLENSKFVIMTHPTMGYYSLIAESENYISMRTDHGERMFRVHEANDDNRMLPGVDTMSITDLMVKDVEDNIIDKIPVKSKPVLPHFKPASDRSIYTIKDGEKEYQLQIKTYENQLIDVDYNRQTRTITVLTNGVDANGMIHAEIIIPNTFNEFLSAESFEAMLNGAFLHDGLFFVDPYSYEGKTAMHYIISTDVLQVLSKEMTEPHSDRLVFTLQSIASDKPVSVRVGEPIQMQSIVTNNIDKKQKFTYILQVKDSTDATVSLSWIDGYIVAKESINTLLSWTPEKEGVYTVQIFLWESLTYPSSMSSNFASSTIIVS